MFPITVKTGKVKPVPKQKMQNSKLSVHIDVALCIQGGGNAHQSEINEVS